MNPQSELQKEQQAIQDLHEWLRQYGKLTIQRKLLKTVERSTIKQAPMLAWLSCWMFILWMISLKVAVYESPAHYLLIIVVALVCNLFVGWIPQNITKWLFTIGPLNSWRYKQVLAPATPITMFPINKGRNWAIRTPGYSGFDNNSQPKTFNQISKVPGFKIKNMIAAMDQKEQEVEKKYREENHARDHFLAHMEASKVKHLDRLQEI